MTFAFIHEHRKGRSVGHLCDLLGVSRSGYYAWRNRGPSRREQEDAALRLQIRALHSRSNKRCGRLSITADLRAQGYKVGHNRIGRLMREDGLVGKPRRRYRQTTDSRHANRIWPDRVRQNFTVQQPNRVWVSDITYIPTRSKWLYLCVVLDLYSRKVIGWSMQTSLSSELAIQAVRMAWRHRAPKTKPIFHSDRGIQYASSQFQHQLQRLGLQPSMSQKASVTTTP